MPVKTTDIDTERRDIDVSKEIARYLPDVNAWLVIALQSRKKTTTDYEFKWFESDPYGYWTKINHADGYAADATSLVVDDASIFAAKDIIKVARTGEVMFCTAVDTDTNTITVIRGYGETAGAVINDDDDLVCLGNAMEEHSSKPTEKLRQPSKIYNYCGIMRTPFGVSGTVEASQQITNEQERARLTRDKSIDHRLAIERQFLFGERKDDTSNKRRMTRGLIKWITTNVYDAGGTLTENEFDKEVCEPVFKYGSKTKLLVASPRMVSIIAGWGKEKLQISQAAKAYGLNLKEYISPHGTLIIAPSQCLEQYYAYHSFIVDPQHIFVRVLRDTTLRRNIHNPDTDGFEDEYLSEIGLELRLEKCHAVIKNATA